MFMSSKSECSIQEKTSSGTIGRMNRMKTRFQQPPAENVIAAPPVRPVLQPIDPPEAVETPPPPTRTRSGRTVIPPKRYRDWYVCVYVSLLSFSFFPLLSYSFFFFCFVCVVSLHQVKFEHYVVCVSNLFVFRFDSSVCVFILIQIESGKAECSRRPICPLSIPLISLCVPRGPCVASLEGASGPKDRSLSVCVCVYWRVAERHLVSRVWDRKPKEGLRRMPGHFRVSVNCQYILSLVIFVVLYYF